MRAIQDGARATTPIFWGAMARAQGNWFFWIVDNAGKRISEIAEVHTDGVAGDGSCQQAVIDFDARR